MLASCTRWALALGLLALAGCRHMVPAPYARGQEPSSAELLEHTGAQLPALQVSKAKVVANRTQRGNLAFLAQAPGRFRGTVDVAGNELVTLAFHEEGYALRYKLDGFPQGFYEGPPSACAVEALLGVRFDTEGLVDLVLGGAPVIEGPHEVLEQKWDRRGGYERLVIANAKLVQELRFGWVGNDWRVVGGQLWERTTAGERGRRLWTVEHTELELLGKAWLPAKTKVSAPGKRRDDTVVISYKERDPDPAFAKQQGGGDDGDTGGDPWGDDDGGDPWEDDEPSNGGWEDEGATPATGEGDGEDDGGWEDGAPADGGAAPVVEGTPEGPAAEPGAVTTPPAAETPEPTRPQPKARPEPPKIPAQFQLDAAGLTVRGDLCR
jgi:hypothetical protein